MLTDVIINIVTSVLSFITIGIADRRAGRIERLEGLLEDTIAETKALRREMEDQRYHKRKNDE